MTNEEAINKLNSLKDYYNDKSEYCEDGYVGFDDEDNEALDKAIKLLESQPCKDCISREAVDNYIAKLLSGYLYEEERTRLEGLSAYLWELPSVKPQRPSKKWIHWTDDHKDYVTCPSCGYGEEGEVLLKDKTPFCPICGEDLRGEEE